MTDKQAECIQRVRALVFFAGQHEEPFLEETVPVWLKLYPSAEVFVYFQTAHFLDCDAATLAGSLENAHRVHVQTTSCSMAVNGFPVGSGSVAEVLDGVTSAVACTGALASDYVMRVAPFTVPMRAEYVAQGIEQGAIQVMGNGGFCPFDFSSYVLSVELWHRIMRIVSLMNVVGMSDGYADLYIQGLSFAVAHTEKFMYLQHNNQVGNVMRHMFDYTKAETPEYINTVVPVAGCVDMLYNPDCDMKLIMHWTRRLTTIALTYNAAS